MSATPIKTQMRVENLSTLLSSPGTAFVNPPIYLWSVFFKIDGSTAQVNATSLTNWTLQGTATVVPTPGNQNDLPGGVQASFDVNETTPIPSSLGVYSTTLEPFPVLGLSGFTVGGMNVGWLGVLLYQENTPADDVAAGHQALNAAVQQALNNLVPTINGANPTLNPASLKGIETQIQNQVENAVKNALSFWNKLATVLNDEYQDVFVGLALQFFSDAQLEASPAQGAPINAQFKWGGKDDPNLYVFTFNGTALANWSPYSLRRILTGLGHTPPISLRAAMGPSAPSSVLAWINEVI